MEPTRTHVCDVWWCSARADVFPRGCVDAWTTLVVFVYNFQVEVCGIAWRILLTLVVFKICKLPGSAIFSG